MDDRQCRPRTPASLLGGVVIIAIGVLLLLDQFDVIRFRDVSRYWPLALVVIGLMKLASGRDASTRIGGAILAGIGAALLAHKLGYLYLEWRLLGPVAIIGVGVWLLFRALHTRRQDEDPAARPAAVLNEWVVFGGGRLVSTAQDFRGGDVLAAFGGYELDLSKAALAGETAIIEATALFGGVEIRVPEDWNVVSKGVAILGGFEDKTIHPRPQLGVRRNELVIKGLAMFGGVEVKN